MDSQLFNKARELFQGEYKKYHVDTTIKEEIIKDFEFKLENDLEFNLPFTGSSAGTHYLYLLNHFHLDPKFDNFFDNKEEDGSFGENCTLFLKAYVTKRFPRARVLLKVEEREGRPAIHLYLIYEISISFKNPSRSLRLSEIQNEIPKRAFELLLQTESQHLAQSEMETQFPEIVKHHGFRHFIAQICSDIEFCKGFELEKKYRSRGDLPDLALTKTYNMPDIEPLTSFNETYKKLLEEYASLKENYEYYLPHCIQNEYDLNSKEIDVKLTYSLENNTVRVDLIPTNV
jgi:hypothetical protein